MTNGMLAQMESLSPLMKCPREVRDLVYAHVFDTQSVTDLWWPGFSHGKLPVITFGPIVIHPLLDVNRQIFVEALPVFLARTEVRVYVTGRHQFGTPEGENWLARHQYLQDKTEQDMPWLVVLNRLFDDRDVLNVIKRLRAGGLGSGGKSITYVLKDYPTAEDPSGTFLDEGTCQRDFKDRDSLSNAIHRHEPWTLKMRDTYFNQWDWVPEFSRRVRIEQQMKARGASGMGPLDIFYLQRRDAEEVKIAWTMIALGPGPERTKYGLKYIPYCSNGENAGVKLDLVYHFRVREIRAMPEWLRAYAKTTLLKCKLIGPGFDDFGNLIPDDIEEEPATEAEIKDHVYRQFRDWEPADSYWPCRYY